MNALTELIDLRKKTPASIKAAEVFFSYNYSEDPARIPLKDKFYLPENYTPQQYDSFMDFMDRKYDNGYGTQYLFGTILFLDGSWASREEYDGSEWWRHNKYPKLDGLNYDKEPMEFDEDPSELCYE